MSMSGQQQYLRNIDILYTCFINNTKALFNGETLHLLPLYFQCRDTFWIESLHMVMLIYAQKRIHFSRKDTYEMRMQLAVLDWVCTTTLLYVLRVASQKVASGSTIYI